MKVSGGGLELVGRSRGQLGGVEAEIADLRRLRGIGRASVDPAELISGADVRGGAGDRQLCLGLAHRAVAQLRVAVRGPRFGVRLAGYRHSPFALHIVHRAADHAGHSQREVVVQLGPAAVDLGDRRGEPRTDGILNLAADDEVGPVRLRTDLFDQTVDQPGGQSFDELVHDRRSEICPVPADDVRPGRTDVAARERIGQEVLGEGLPRLGELQSGGILHETGVQRGRQGGRVISDPPVDRLAGRVEVRGVLRREIEERDEPVGLLISGRFGQLRGRRVRNVVIADRRQQPLLPRVVLGVSQQVVEAGVLVTGQRHDVAPAQHHAMAEVDRLAGAVAEFLVFLAHEALRSWPTDHGPAHRTVPRLPLQTEHHP